MSIASSTFYDLTRIREVSPEAQDWAAVDANFEIIGLILKQLEQHSHSGATAINYPGYDPTTPILATLSELTTGGILPPGTDIGVRISYVNALGLETAASPEVNITTAGSASKPLTPLLQSTQTAAGAMPGGTYIYVITKVKAAGETVPSDVLTVTIPYDQTYSATLAFDAINTYTDGTTALNIYKSTGLNASFVLQATISGAAIATYIDTNATPLSTGQQPPASSTFDATRKIRIDWSTITHPTPTSSKLRVYVTQQANLWGTTALLTEIDLLSSPPTFVDYLGNESLFSGWPRAATQIPDSSPKIDLSSQTTGAPTLTANMNFAGFQALNLRLHNNAGAPASPTNGYIYYDSSIPTVRAFINGAWVNWGTTAATAYTHPAEEAGGHLAANIKYTTGGTALKTILDRVNTTTGAAKQVQTVVKSTATTNNPSTTTTAMNTAVFVPEMSITSPVPVFDNQWMEIVFVGEFQMVAAAAGMLFNYCLEVGGVSQQPRTIKSPMTSWSAPVEFTELVQLGTVAVGAKTVKLLWWVSTGTVTAVNISRALVARLIY